MPPPPRAPSLGPKRDVKQLHWNMISGANASTSLFSKDHVAFEISEDAGKELEDLFSSNPVVKEVAPADPEENAQGQDKSAGILDQKRKTNIEIVLRKFEASPKEIAEAVRTLDALEATLTTENVQALAATKITDEEVLLATAYQPEPGDVDKISKAEQFVYYLTRVPRFSNKIGAMLTMRSVRPAAKELEQDMECVLRACHEVLENEKLHKLLGGM